MNSDSIKLPENNYSFKKEFEKDIIHRNEKEIISNKHFIKQPSIHYNNQEFIHPLKKQSLENSISFCDKEIVKTYKFELDMFKLSDYEFVNWANQQTTDFLIMAVMAEMKSAPKMRNEIERLRPEVYKIPLMPIHEYIKLRKLGDRYAFFLRKLKQEYGNHLLRILYLTSNSF